LLVLDELLQEHVWGVYLWRCESVDAKWVARKKMNLPRKFFKADDANAGIRYFDRKRQCCRVNGIAFIPE
jgi:hypothetical protein